MAWTTPRTWVTNEVVTAALLNTHVRDNLNFLRANAACRSYASATQTIAPGGSGEFITFNTDDYDTVAMHDVVTNNSRFIVPAGYDGYWRFHCIVTTDADTTGSLTRRLYFRKNAAGVASLVAADRLQEFYTQSQAGGIKSLVLTWEGPLVAGDYIEAFCFAQTENVVLDNTSSGRAMTATYLGS